MLTLCLTTKIKIKKKKIETEATKTYQLQQQQIYELTIKSTQQQHHYRKNVVHPTMLRVVRGLQWLETGMLPQHWSKLSYDLLGPVSKCRFVSIDC